MSDIGQAFKYFKDYIFPKYRGLLIERSGDKFLWNKKVYNSWEKVTKAIDRELVNFGKNFNQIKK